MIATADIEHARDEYRRATIPLRDCESVETLKDNIRALISRLEKQGWRIDSMLTEGGSLHLTFCRGPHGTETEDP